MSEIYPCDRIFSQRTLSSLIGNTKPSSKSTPIKIIMIGKILTGQQMFASIKLAWADLAQHKLPPPPTYTGCTFQTWWKGSLCTHTLIFENRSITWNISQRELKYFYWKFDLNCPPTKIWPCLSFHKNFSKYCDWDSVWLGAAADGFRFRHFWQETPSDVEYHCSGWRPLLHYAIPLSVDSSVPQIDASPDPPSLPFLIRSSGESRSQAGFPLEPPHSPRSQIYWPLLAGFCLPPSFIQVVFSLVPPRKVLRTNKLI